VPALVGQSPAQRRRAGAPATAGHCSASPQSGSPGGRSRYCCWSSYAGARRSRARCLLSRARRTAAGRFERPCA